MCCVCCTIKTKGKNQAKEVRIKYKQRTKKNVAEGMDVCLLCVAFCAGSNRCDELAIRAEESVLPDVRFRNLKNEAV